MSHKTGRVMRSMAPPSTGEGDGDRIVLWSWSTAVAKRLRNIARVAPDNRVKWLAELPEGPERDCFVTLGTTGGMLDATTWSGMQLSLDAETGRVLSLDRCGAVVEPRGIEPLTSAVRLQRSPI